MRGARAFRSTLALIALLAPAGARGAGRRTAPSAERGTPDAATTRSSESSDTVSRPAASRPAAEVLIDFGLERGLPGETVTVSVRAEDAEQKPTDASVSVFADVGDVGEVVRVERGRYRAPLVLPKVLPRHRSAYVLVRADSVSNAAILPLSPGPPASLRVDGPKFTGGDGTTLSVIAVIVSDAFGNPAAELPAASATHGQVSVAEPLGPGRWVIRYRAPRLVSDAEDVVSVQVGPTRGTHAMRLTAPATALGLAPRIGTVLSSARIALAIGAGASTWWRFGRGQAGVVLEGSWWRLRRSDTAAIPGGPVDLSGEQRYAPLTAALSFEHRLGRHFSTWVSLGGGAARVSATARLAGQPAVSGAAWAPVASAAVALGVRAWAGSPFFELRWMWIGDPHLATLSGPYRPVLVNVGYFLDAR